VADTRAFVACDAGGLIAPQLMSLITPAIIVFPLLMAFAASSDLLTMRISNGLVLAVTLLFFAVAIWVQMPLEQLALHVGIACIVLVVGFAFFAFGWIGGGDAKLAAATVLWVGLGQLLPYLVYAALLGGALTLSLLAIRRWPLPVALAQVKWIDRLHDPKSGVPYGVALAASAILVYSRTDIFQHLIL
jgi:prepilin peptidase CpaA